MHDPEPTERLAEKDVIARRRGSAAWHAVVRRLTSLFAAVVAGLAVALAAADLLEYDGPAGPPRLQPLGYAALLTLETPPQPGTPISGRVHTSAAPFVVRAECIGIGLLTVSLNTESGFAIHCRRGGRTVERYVHRADLGDVRGGAGMQAFLLAQVGGAEHGTVWRVTVRSPR